MGCPFHGGDSDSTEMERGGDEGSGAGGATGRDRGMDRRTFVKSAMVIGGAGALTQLESLAGLSPEGSDDDRRAIGAGERLNRQHAWDAFEDVAGSLNTKPPHNTVFLMLDYEGGGEPSPGHRKQVAGALDGIERNFEWHSKGVMFTMAYSAEYFDRFEAAPPEGAAPWDQETVVERSLAVTTDDDIDPEPREAMLMLASDNAANLLAVEEALWGGDGPVEFEHTFEGVFERPRTFPDRRVGFLGPDLPKDRYEDELDVDVPDGAPLSMGFVAGFDASMPGEDAVTLEEGQRFPNPDVDAAEVPTGREYVGEVGTRDPGVFAQGTLKHVSHVELDLDAWYERDEADRRVQMYSPFHTESDVGDVGENLTKFRDAEPGAEEVGDGEVVRDLPARDPEAEDYAELAEATAEGGTALTDGTPTLGHSQKAARARYDVDGDDELEQPVLRRDWDTIVSAGEGQAGYLFNIPTRFNESAMSMFDANYGLEFTSLDGRIDHSGEIKAEERNGIAPFMEATFRGHFLVPPITVRALPHPRAEEADLSVERKGGRYFATVEGAPNLDASTVRFGDPADVNRAKGAEPVAVDRSGPGVTYAFDADAVDVGGTARLFAKREGDRKPVVGTAAP